MSLRVHGLQTREAVYAFVVHHPDGTKSAFKPNNQVMRGSQEERDFKKYWVTKGSDVTAHYGRPTNTADHAEQMRRFVRTAETMARSGVTEGKFRIPHAP